ncbi:MAG: PorT family protein [Bacteroidetes bacterium]|nr:PorT family protein [Bacteroidota bacterium]HET6245091.1 porin family protein [Bacteroidia bacterium]
MKKSLIIIGLFALAFGTKVKAQDSMMVATPKPDFNRVEFGVRFMPTLSSFDMQTSSGGTIKGEATLGYGFGAILGFNFSNHVGLSGEIIYNSLSQKYTDNDMQREFNVRYVNIPLLLSLNTGKSNPVNLKVEFGPQIGYSLGASVTTAGGGDSDTLQTVISTKSGDFGAAYGAGLEFILNSKKTLRLDIGYRGVYGFVNVSNTNQPADGTYYILDRAIVRTNSAYLGFTCLF